MDKHVHINKVAFFISIIITVICFWWVLLDYPPCDSFCDSSKVDTVYQRVDTVYHPIVVVEERFYTDTQLIVDTQRVETVDTVTVLDVDTVSIFKDTERSHYAYLIVQQVLSDHLKESHVYCNPYFNTTVDTVYSYTNSMGFGEIFSTGFPSKISYVFCGEIVVDQDECTITKYSYEVSVSYRGGPEIFLQSWSVNYILIM